MTCPTGTDSFTYNALGQRTRALLNGTARRYVYNGERVLEETDDANATQVRYTTADSSYFAPLLHFKRSDRSMRYPLYDATGSVLRVVDGSATVTDTYTLDSFGRQTGGSGTTPNPYRFGGDWGYITDTPGSGLLQLGHRVYWPELGRFLQQDPIGDGVNWYAYVDDNPITGVDPEGRIPAWLKGLGVAGGLAALAGAPEAWEALNTMYWAGQNISDSEMIKCEIAKPPGHGPRIVPKGNPKDRGPDVQIWIGQYGDEKYLVRIRVRQRMGWSNWKDRWVNSQGTWVLPP